MRWEPLRLFDDESAAPPLIARGAVTRTFDTPEFAGLTFYEIHAKSIINTVSAASAVPFGHTINPYRGCSHACVYCFARKTHEYLDLGYGEDFDSKIIVKVNAAQRLRAELARPSWSGAPIAMGTNVDCYQRAEGRYRLMPGIISALTDHANPFSILTKGTLILRDLELLAHAATVTDVSAAVSVGFLDPALWRAVEPGTPRPSSRLDVCARLNDSGIDCGVLMAPILPYLTDSPEALRSAVSACADAGAVSVTGIVLHLRPGAREWYSDWLRREHPHLVEPYRRLYGTGSYARRDYRDHVSALIRQYTREFGVDGRRRHRTPPPTPPPEPEAPPTLF
ncbi:Rv2578c family radical SAM protein [Stackebrandtia soli]|uniref:Rv2578c family radical SAM protein n=1 Tax=Stackebrandtia soli TaxID=1892856 RepID=UPI0039ECF9A2